MSSIRENADYESNRFEEANQNTKEVYDNLHEIAEKYSAPYFTKIKELNNIVANVSTMTLEEMCDFLGKMTVELNHLREVATNVTLKEQCADILQKSMYADVAINSEGPQQQKANYALLESQPEKLVSLLYKNVSKKFDIQITNGELSYKTVNSAMIVKNSVEKRTTVESMKYLSDERVGE